ncbi:MAG: TIM barrel protein [Terriglobia bacterium]
MINRRDFIRSTALGAATMVGGSGLTRNLFANPYGKPIGLQLYTLRDELEKDVPGTIKKVAAIGYREVETYDLYGMPASQFAKLLNDNGLTAPSGHYMLKDIRTHWEKSIGEARDLGLKYMVNAILEPEDRKSFDDYKQLVDVFNKAAEQTHQAGIQFCYHNHNFEFKKYGQTTAYDYLHKHLDPNLVQFEMDCFWVIHAGQDPVTLFKKYPGRFPLLHIKDLKAGNPPTTEFDARMGLFAEVGKGTIDWKRIFAAAPQGGMKHFYVEQDYCEVPPLESVKISYEYLHHLTV